MIYLILFAVLRNVNVWICCLSTMPNFLIFFYIMLAVVVRSRRDRGLSKS